MLDYRKFKQKEEPMKTRDLHHIGGSRMFFTILSSFSLAFCAVAEETNLEKAQTLQNEAQDQAMQGFRNGQDEMCSMTNGKVVCLARKAKHRTKNFVDRAKTKTIQIKNKVN